MGSTAASRLFPQVSQVSSLSEKTNVVFFLVFLIHFSPLKALSVNCCECSEELVLFCSRLYYQTRFWTCSVNHWSAVSPISSIMPALHFPLFYASFTALLSWFQMNPPLSGVLCSIAQAWAPGPWHTRLCFSCISYFSSALKADVRWVTLLPSYNEYFTFCATLKQFFCSSVTHLLLVVLEY